MASLNSIYIKLETLETLVKGLKQKGEKGISIDLSINDTVNDYGQNISAYVSQTKEQRDAKKDRYYVGNGKTFWTDGVIKVAAKKVEEQTAKAVSIESDEVPF
jgi:hypothetical protein